MSAAPSVAVSVVSAGLALALLSLLLHKLLRALAVLAVLLLPLPLRLFGALHAVAALPLGVAGQAASLRAVVVGAGLWVLGHWLFARGRGYYAGALGRRVLRAMPLPGLDPTRGHEQRPVYEYVPRPVVLVLGR